MRTWCSVVFVGLVSQDTTTYLLVFVSTSSPWSFWGLSSFFSSDAVRRIDERHQPTSSSSGGNAAGGMGILKGSEPLPCNVLPTWMGPRGTDYMDTIHMRVCVRRSNGSGVMFRTHFWETKATTRTQRTSRASLTSCWHVDPSWSEIFCEACR
jgi:hypothetical protein